MSAVDPDYDRDPARSRSFQLGWQEDVHGPVADRLAAEGVDVAVDIGCGTGRFAAAIQGRFGWIGIDSSPRQIADCRPQPVVRADACGLPLADETAGAVVQLWMLYHLRNPRKALAEAARILRPGGLLATCAPSRFNDPELVPEGVSPTSFDAEEAPAIVADVLGSANIEIERWDQPLVQIRDSTELEAYARAHLLELDSIADIELPVTLTKRGCLIWARNP